MNWENAINPLRGGKNMLAKIQNKIIVVMLTSLFILMASQCLAVTIDNDYVSFDLDHSTGNITRLVLKQGSNTNIVDPYWNNTNVAGAFRLYTQYGDPNSFKETDDVLEEYTPSSDGLSL